MKNITYFSNKEHNLFFKNNFTYIARNPEENLSFNNELSDNNSNNIFIPLDIFNNGISGLEAISKYLIEVVKLRNCEIANLLNRDSRTIWGAYHNAKQKSDENFSDKNYGIKIPLEIFYNRTLGVLESLTVYLKEDLNLRYCKIASLINKNDMTIWTAYNRAKKKRKNAENN